MTEKDKKDLLSEESLEDVGGGGCWFDARFVAPDGHDVGCGQAFITCSRCGHYVDKEGKFTDGWGVVAD